MFLQACQLRRFLATLRSTPCETETESKERKGHDHFPRDSRWCDPRNIIPFSFVPTVAARYMEICMESSFPSTLRSGRRGAAYQRYGIKKRSIKSKIKTFATQRVCAWGDFGRRIGHSDLQQLPMFGRTLQSTPCGCVSPIFGAPYTHVPSQSRVTSTRILYAASPNLMVRGTFGLHITTPLQRPLLYLMELQAILHTTMKIYFSFSNPPGPNTASGGAAVSRGTRSSCILPLSLGSLAPLMSISSNRLFRRSDWSA